MVHNFFFLTILLVLLGCQASGEGGGSDVVADHKPTAPKFTLSTTLNRTYSETQSIDLNLSFPKIVTVTGSPQINFTIGSTSRVADYLTGDGTKVLTFRYIVAAGDNDNNGITVSNPLNLNGGTLQFDLDGVLTNCDLVMKLPTLTSVKVDTTAPSINSVTAPANKTYYNLQHLNFNVVFSESVIVTGSPRLALDIDGSTKYATYVSGSNSSTLIFRYIVGANDVDMDGIDVSSPLDLNGGVIKDAGAYNSGLTFTAPDTSAVLVSGSNPVITSITPPVNATYLVNQNLNFTVTFNENVNVTGTPRLTLDVGGVTKYANYISGSGTSSLLFRYSVVGGDIDNNGIGLTNSIGLNGGTIQDASSNAAILSFTVPSLANVKVFTTAPSIASISLPGSIPAGGFDLAQNVDFTVNFTEAMTEAGGTSRLKLTVGSLTRYATYVSGSGTSSFIYRYTVGVGEEDLNGLAIVSPFELNGSTVKNSGGVNLALSFTSPNTSSVKIDAVAPTILSNTVPSAATYIAGQNLDYNVTFSEPVTVSGTPRISLDIGGVTRYANYLSGSGSSVIRFRYTIISGDNDTDGIDTSSTIDLNAGTIRDGLLHNAALVIPTSNTTGVKIDNTVPTIVSVTPPADGSYAQTQNLDFTVNFSENISITGTPRLQLNIGGVTRYATYVSGSGTANVLFRYTIGGSDEDTDGIGIASPLQLNSGTIRDAALNNASLTFTLPDTIGITVAGSNPIIISITPPANGEYTAAQNLDFTVVFSKPVIVTPTPRIAITLASGTVYADYVSGGGTDTLLFRYTVQATDNDSDGIALVSPLDVNGGAIQDLTMSQNAILTFTPPTTSGITVDGADAMISSVTAPSNDTYIVGENLDFTVAFTSSVIVTGSPRIPITVGSSNVYATYSSGSGSTNLIFRYTVSSNNEDTDGVEISSPVDLNAGTIKDGSGDNALLTFTAPSTSGVLVDGIVPTISSITGPADGTYYNDEHLDFIVTTSESVAVTGSPRLTLTVGSSTEYATYLAGTGTNSLTFRYTVGAGDSDANGVVVSSPLDLNSGTLKDLPGNNVSPLSFVPPTTSAVNIDGNLASIISLSAPADAVYETGNTLDFVATFSRAVTVTGTPRIEVTVGASTYYATYHSGSGTSAVTFRYTVAVGHSDTDGITLTSPVQLNAGTIKDSSNNNATLTFTSPDTSNIKVDGIDAAIATFTPPANGIYKLSDNMDFVVEFNYPVTISGSPRIELTIGALTRHATYVSGSGTTTITFRHVVLSDEEDTDGIDTIGTSISLNGGTIQDAFGDNAEISTTATNYPNKKVDGIVPTITSVTGPADATYYEGADLDFTVNFSENVTVTGIPRIALTIGSTTKYASYLSGSGSTALIYRYTVVSGDNDTNGIASASPIDLNSGTIKDAALNDVTPLTFTPPATTGVIVNALGATILSITPPANATYDSGANLDFTVVYSRPVDVVGSPRIDITLATGTVYATYLSGSGTDTLVFRYTAQVGEADADGIQLTSPISLNSGTIKDSSLVNASLAFTVPSTTGVLVDGIDIVVSAITPPADGTYKIGDVLSFTVTYNYPADTVGAPRIQLTIGSATKYASYQSGSGTTDHIFSYTVASGDTDIDGITTVGPAIELNSGTIKDQFGDDANINFTASTYTNKKVDGIRPTISSMSVSANKTYIIGENINFTATYSENVTISGTPRLTLTVGSTTRYADYVSGTGTSSIVFRYTVLAGDLDTNGITAASAVDLNGGSITDIPGNTQTALTFTPPTLTGVNVDGIAPTVSSITSPTLYHGLNSNINFTVNFSEAVTVTGTPTLTVQIGGATKTASYVSGSGSTAIVYRYTTVLNDEDTDGVTPQSPLLLASGTLKDASGNNAVLTFTNATISGAQVDAVPPTIVSITPPANAIYKTASLDFIVTFSESVTITGTPRLALAVGANTRQADQISGSGTTYTYRYSATGTDIDLDGIEFGNVDLDLNGATIVDARLNVAVLTLPSVDMSGVIATITKMRNWYDWNDTSSLTFNGMNVTAIQDKINTYHLSYSNGTGATYNATGFGPNSRSFISCNTSSYFRNAANYTSPRAVVSVFKAPPNAGSGSNQILFYADSTSRAAIYFSATYSGGVVDFGNKSGSQFVSGAWGGLATTETNVWSANAVIARAFQLNGTETRDHTMCRMTGEMSEFIMFDSVPSVSEMTQIEAYINTKYGLSFP